jgi:hypothetical protein
MHVLRLFRLLVNVIMWKSRVFLFLSIILNKVKISYDSYRKATCDAYKLDGHLEIRTNYRLVTKTWLRLNGDFVVMRDKRLYSKVQSEFNLSVNAVFE